LREGDNSVKNAKELESVVKNEDTKEITFP
jgi:hypothetical protein